MKKNLLLLFSIGLLLNACKKEGLIKQNALSITDDSKEVAFNAQVLVADPGTALATKTNATPLFKYLTVYRERYNANSLHLYVLNRVLVQVSGTANFGSITLTRKKGDYFMFVGSNDTTFKVGPIFTTAENTGEPDSKIVPGEFSIYYYKPSGTYPGAPIGPVSAPSQLFTYTMHAFDPNDPIKTEQIVLKCGVAKVSFTLTDAASQPKYDMIYMTLKNGSNNLNCATNSGFSLSEVAFKKTTKYVDQVVAFKVPANGWHGFTGTAYFFSSSTTYAVIDAASGAETAGSYVYVTLSTAPVNGNLKILGLPNDQLVTNTAYNFSGSLFSKATQPGYSTGADTSYTTSPAESFAILPKENFKIVKH